MVLVEKRMATQFLDGIQPSNTSFIHSRLALVPRGSTGKLKRAEIVLIIDDQISLTNTTIFAGISQKLAGFGSPSKTQDVVDKDLTCVTAVGVFKVGIPTAAIHQLTAGRATRQYEDEPHEQAQIRNVGVRSNFERGWSTVIYRTASSSASLAHMHAEIQFTITYIGSGGSRRNVSLEDANEQEGPGGAM